MRRGAIALSLSTVLAGGLGACSSSCPAAIADGTLVETGPAELGLRWTVDSHVTAIRWPLGHAIRLDGERLVVADPFGSVILREGDSVGLGGAEGPDGWNVCGEIIVRNQNEVSPG